MRPEDQIKSWTKEDYLSGVAPYEWLYSFKDNAFQLARLRGLMLEDARQKKVPSPGALWKAYVETQLGQQSRDVGQNVTGFTGQEMELLCGDYGCYDDGIKIINQYGAMTVVCPHPIMPTKRLVNIDTGEVKTEIGFRRGNGWRHTIVDKSVLANARSITSLAACGISVNSESAKDLVRYLAYLEDANYDQLPEIKTVGRLGWVDGYGFSPYVDGLIYDAGGLYGDAFAAVHAQGSWEAWRDLALQVRAGKSIPCRIALAASFASVLVPKMGALPFILHLWGSVSGIGKSVALILAASVWAYPEIGSYVKTTKSTNVGYEQMAAFCGNLPLCMDELQMIQGKKEFDELIYSLCEGVSKTRGAKAGGVQQVQRWRNAIITTGEQPITTANSKAGAVNRVIEVECSEKLFEDARAAYQLLVTNYGHAGRKFVEALQESSDAMEVMTETQQAFYKRLQGCATDKQVLTASLILAADAMADLLLFDDGHSLSAEEIIPYLVTTSQADTNRKAYEWLCDWVASNPAKFTPDSEGYTNECWGRIKGERVYIIKSVFEKALQNEGFNASSFLSWANKAGKIICQGGKRTRVLKMHGVNTRCVDLALPGAVDNEGNTDVSTDCEVEEVFEQMKMD
mgnify:FL=1